MVADLDECARQCEALDIGTAIEGFLADGGQLRLQGDRSEGVATYEGFLANGGEFGGQHDGLERRTALEGVHAQFCHATERTQLIESGNLGVAHEETADIINSHGLTVSEFTVVVGIPVLHADCFHHGVFELHDNVDIVGIFANLAEILPHVGSSISVLVAFEHAEHHATEVYIIKHIRVDSQRRSPLHCDCLQVGTTLEGIFADRGNHVGDSDGLQRRTFAESLFIDGGHFVIKTIVVDSPGKYQIDGPGDIITPRPHVRILRTVAVSEIRFIPACHHHRAVGTVGDVVSDTVDDNVVGGGHGHNTN